MPNLFVTLKGKRVNINSITSKSRPYVFSKAFHTEDRAMLQNEISANSRNLTALQKMPKSKTTLEDIKRLTIDSKLKRNEINHRNEMEKKHNLRKGK